MNVKKRIIIGRVITFLMGIVIALFGFLSKNDVLQTMGVLILVMSVIKSIQIYRLCKNEEKFKEYETAYTDERNVFLANKSYSWAFWISIYAEFVAICVYSYFGKAEFASLISTILCFQIVVYIVAYFICKKKY